MACFWPLAARYFEPCIGLIIFRTLIVLLPDTIMNVYSRDLPWVQMVRAIHVHLHHPFLPNLLEVQVVRRIQDHPIYKTEGFHSSCHVLSPVLDVIFRIRL